MSKNGVLERGDMTQYVAFLRAINVGGHTVKMTDLRALFEALEFTNVETFIASGNVIFDSPVEQAGQLEQKIETHLHQSLGYPVATFLRSVPELAQIARHEPFQAFEFEAGAGLYVAFLQHEPTDETRRKLMSFRNATDDFHVHQREVYWLCRTKFSESALSGAIRRWGCRRPCETRAPSRSLPRSTWRSSDR
jgi:uncharacterized protein (DUF1697 family)